MAVVTGVNAAALVAPAPRGAAVEIFRDGFESGDTSAWSDAVGLPEVPATAFRITELALRDPHVFINVFDVSCLDFTDASGLVPSLNSLVDETLNGDEGGDGFLDASALLVFRPLVVTPATQPLDFAPAMCISPAAMTACTIEPQVIPEHFLYSSAEIDGCGSVIGGTTTGYEPAIVEPLAPCFATSTASTFQLDLGPLSIPLREVRMGAEWEDTPPTSVADGIITGFLLEQDADTTLLPLDLPFVGGEPLSVLLPGGQGSCAAGDDRDTYLSDSGWWIYLNFSAEQVPFTDN